MRNDLEKLVFIGDEYKYLLTIGNVYSGYSYDNYAYWWILDWDGNTEINFANERGFKRELFIPLAEYREQQINSILDE